MADFWGSCIHRCPSEAAGQPEPFGIQNGDMEGSAGDVMEDPSCCEAGDPFEGSVVTTDEPEIPPEPPSDVPHFGVDDPNPSDDDEGDLGAPPEQEPVTIDGHDEPDLEGDLHEIDDTVDVTGNEEYPGLDTADDDGGVYTDGILYDESETYNSDDLLDELFNEDDDGGVGGFPPQEVDFPQVPPPSPGDSEGDPPNDPDDDPEDEPHPGRPERPEQQPPEKPVCCIPIPKPRPCARECVYDKYAALSDEEVWGGRARQRGACEDIDPFESDTVKRRRLLDEDDEWEVVCS